MMPIPSELDNATADAAAFAALAELNEERIRELSSELYAARSRVILLSNELERARSVNADMERELGELRDLVTLLHEAADGYRVALDDVCPQERPEAVSP